LDLNNLINQSQLQKYASALVDQGLSDSSIRRKLSALTTFQKFLAKKKLIDKPMSRISSPITLATRSTDHVIARNPKPAEGDVSITLPINSNSPNRLKSFLFNRYFIVASVLLLLSGLGYTLYTQVFNRANKNLAYSSASSPVAPNRILSFQGRLTDSSGNPITSSTGITFKLFTLGSGGTELYNSGAGNSQTVIPDENGIFSVVIGKSHGLGIASSVFSENAEVWLEITAGGETMNPRQQIATVGYALNSETLQGLPPSASGFKNTVLVIDGSGNLNLGETSPTIYSQSGTLGIIGQAILIGSSDGSGGNITINPDGAGKLKFITEGTGSTATGGLIEATNANLASGNLYSAYINNDNRGYKFLDFSNYNVGTTTLSSRFSIDAYGNLATAGTINTSIGITTPRITISVGATSGYILQTDAFGNASWVNPGSAGIGTSYDAGNGLTKVGSLFKFGGALTENTRLNIGNTEVLYVDYATGRIGIGTTSPLSTFQVKGNTVNFENGVSGSLAEALRFSQASYPTSYTHSIYVRQGVTVDQNIMQFRLSDGTVSGQSTPLTLRGSGNVGIGTTSPNYKLEVSGDALISTRLGIGATHPLYAFNVGGTSMLADIYSYGSLGLGTTAPTYKLELVGSNSIFRIGDTAGNTLVDISETSAQFNLPTTFTSTGDVNMANDLNFTNQTASTIRSNAPLYIEAGESFENNDLTLKTFGTGNVVFDSAGLTLLQAQSWTLASGTTNALNVSNGLISIDTLNSRVGIGTSSPTKKLDVAGDINLTGTIYTTGTSGSVGQVLTSTGSGLQWATNVGTTYTFTNGINLTGSNVGLGGTLTQNTQIGTSSYHVDFIGLGGTQSLHLDESGYVGIGTTSPGYQLDVAGNLRTANGLLTIFSSGNIPYVSSIAGKPLRLTSAGSVAETNGITVDTAGDVGIGTTDPTYKLTVVGGDIALDANKSIYWGTGGTQTYQTVNAGWMDYFYAGSKRFQIDLNTSSYNAITSILTNLKIGTSANNTDVIIAPTRNAYLSVGNFGIGVTSPTKKLDVAGDINLTGTIFSNGTSGTSGQVLTSTGTGLQWVNAASVGGTYTFNNGITNSAGTVGLGGTLNANTTISTSTFGLGIGTAGNSLYNLSVGGTSTFVDQYITGGLGIGAINNNSYAKLTSSISSATATAGLFINNIASTAPPSAYDGVNLTLSNGNTTPNNWIKMYFTDRSDTGTPASAIATQITNHSSNIGDLAFFTNQSSNNLLERMRITSTGNVGIGTTNPTYKLDVNGNVKIGTSSAGFDLQLYASGSDESVKWDAANSRLVGTDGALTKFYLQAKGSQNDGIFTSMNAAGTGKVAQFGDAAFNIGSGGLIRLYNTPTWALGVDPPTIANTEVLEISSATGSIGINPSGNATAPTNQILNINWAGSSASNLTAIKVEGSNSGGGAFSAATFGGNVGINNTNPNYDLDITGDINLTGTIFSNGTSGTSGQVLTSTGTGLQWINAASVGGTYTFTNGITNTAGTVGLGGTLTSNTIINTGANSLSFLGLGNSQSLFVGASGYVGIGTTDPHSQLDITAAAGYSSNNVGQIRIVSPTNLDSKFLIGYDTTNQRGYLQPVETNVAFRDLLLNPSGGNVGIGIGDSAPSVKLEVGGNVKIRGSGSALTFVNQNNTTFTVGQYNIVDLFSIGQGAPYLNINTSGNVGIGTTNPGALLQIGAADTAGTGPVFAFKSTGRLGIGTTNPSYPLHIYTSTGNAYEYIQTATNAGEAGIKFKNFNSQEFSLGKIGSGLGGADTFNLSSSNNASIMQFSYSGVGYLNGNISIGKSSSPTKTLDVAGDINLTGTIFSNGTSGTSGQVLTSTGTGLQWINAASVGGTYTFTNGITNTAGTVGLGGTLTSNTIINTGANSLSFLGLANTQGLFIGASGYVGIGTTNPSSILNISTGDSGLVNMFTLENNFQSEDQGTGILFRDTNVAGGDGAARIRSAAYNYGNAGLVFDTNNSSTLTERLRISADGLVGIGTSTPAYKLDIAGDINLTGTIFANGSSGSAGQVLTSTGVGLSWVPTSAIGSTYTFTNGITNTAGTVGLGGTLTSATIINTGANSLSFLGLGNTQGLFIGASGYVGIGTTNPTEKFQIDGTGNVRSIVNVTDNTTGSWADFYASSNSTLLLMQSHASARTTTRYGQAVGGWSEISQWDISGSKGLLIGTVNAKPLVLGTGSTERMRIDSSGNVGIGTTTPSKKLDIAGDINLTGTIFSNGTSGTSGQILTSTGTGLQWVNSSTIGSTYAFTNGLTNNAGTVGLGGTLTSNTIINTGANSLSFLGLGNTQSLFVGASGYVGIGTTNPGYKLSFGTLGGNQSIALYDDGNANNFYGFGAGNSMLKFYSASAAASPEMVITSTGNVGIGTTSPNYKLEVSGDALISTRLGIGSTNILYSLNVGNTANFTNLFASGNVGIGTTAPTYKLELVGSNSIFRIGDTAGNTLVDISETSAQFNLPTTFSSSGDVNLAYDLNFTNTTASYIRSNAPLYIQTEHPTNNVDLILSAANSGAVIVDDNLQVGGTFTYNVGASAGFILQTDANGNASWVASSAVGSTYTFTNGLTYTAGNVGLGGTLTSNTKINTGANSLSFLGLGNSQALFIGASGYIGVGTTNPNQMLHVKTGNIYADGGNILVNQTAKISLNGTPSVYFMSGSSDVLQMFTASVERLRIDSAGLIGIGTTNPTALLDITGPAGLGGSTSFFNAIGGISPVGGRSGGITLSTGNGATAGINDDGGSGGNISITAGSGTIGGDNATTDGSGGSITLTAGTHTDWLGGGSDGDITLNSNNINLNIAAGGYVKIPNLTIGAGSTVLFVNSTGQVYKGVISAGTTYTFTNGLTNTTGVVRIGGTLTQNTQIGTSSFKLSFLGLGNSQAMTINSNGYIGIGITDPASVLHVVQNSTSVVPGLTLQNTTTAGGGIALDFSTFGGVGANNQTARIINKRTDSPSTGDADLQFWTYASGLAQRMVIKSTGEIGIGNTNPSKKLDITGDINLTGTIFSNGTSGTNGQVLTSTGTGLQWINSANVGGTYTFTNGITNTAGVVGLGGTLTANTQIGTSSFGFSIYGASGNPAINVGTNGNVGIGRTSHSSYQLAVSSASDTYNMTSTTNNSGSARLRASSNTSRVIALDQYGSTVAGSIYGIANANLSLLEATGDNFMILADVGPIAFINGSTETMRLSTAGNVGIGTTAPSKKLDIAGDINLTGTIFDNGVSGSPGQVLTSTGTGLAWVNNVGTTYSFTNGLNLTGSNVSLGGTLTSNTIINTGANSLSFLGLGNTQGLFIGASGNVGIGTSNPIISLEVWGKIRSANIASPYAELQSFANTNNNQAQLVFNNRYDSKAIFGVTDGATAATFINRSLSIGNSNTPTKTLDIAGDINLTGTIFSNGTSGTNGQVLSSTGTGLAWINNVGTTYSFTNGLNLTGSNVGLGGTLTSYTDINTSAYSLTIVGSNVTEPSFNVYRGITTLNNYDVGRTWVTTALFTINNQYNEDENTPNRGMRAVSYHGAGGAYGAGLAWGMAPTATTWKAGQYSSGQFLLAYDGNSLSIGGTNLDAGGSNPTFTPVDYFTITNDGKIGLKNSNPSKQLDVTGDINLTGTIFAAGASGTSGQVLSSTGTGLQWIAAGAGSTYAFTNGLTNTAGTVRIGGTLTQNTQIGTSSFSLRIGQGNTQPLFISSGGLVGIGNTAPTTALHIGPGTDTPLGISYDLLTLSNNGNTGLALRDSTANLELELSTYNGVGYLGTKTNHDLTLFVNNSMGELTIASSNGFVGIGTTSPTKRLDVAGDIKLTGTIFVGAGVTGSNNQVLASNGAGGLQWITAGGVGSTYTFTNGLTNNSGVVGLGGTLTANTQIGTSSFSLSYLGLGGSQSLFINNNGYVAIGTNNPFGPFQVNVGGTAALFVSSTGNIGIGTSNPGAKLDIAGASSNISNTSGDITISAASSQIGFSGNSLKNISNITLTGTLFVGAGVTGSNNQVLASNGAGSLQWVNSGGVGTTYAFTNGLTNNSNTISLGGTLTANTTIGTSSFSLSFLGMGNSQALFIGTSGYVGIGSTNPSVKLDIVQNINNTASSRVYNSNSGSVASAAFSTQSDNGIFSIGAFSSNYTLTNFAGRAAIITDPSNPSDGVDIVSSLNTGDFRLYTGGYTAAEERLRVTSTGNLGLGTTSPSKKLDVVGDIKLTGTLFVGAGVTGSSGQILASNGAGGLQWVNDAGGTGGSSYTATNGLTLTGSAFGLGGTLTQNTTIGTSSFGLSFLGLGNSQSLFIGASGFVGIGTTSPLAKFTINGGTNNNSALAIRNTDVWATFRNMPSTNNFAIDVLSGGSELAIGSTAYNLLLNPSGGYIGIGTTNPSYKLEIAGSTNNYLSYIYNAGTSASSGGLNVRSDGLGNVFNANYAGTDLLTVSPVQTTINNPANFTSAGDISAAYDLNFTNSSSSTIRSSAPLYLTSGEVFNSSNLNLTTYNSGRLVLDTPGGVVLGQAQNWTLGNGTTSTTALNIQSGLLNFDTKDNEIGIGTTNPQAKLQINSYSGGYYLDLGNGQLDPDIITRVGESGYGFRWYYDGSGSGNTNYYRLVSENAAGTPFDMLKFGHTTGGLDIYGGYTSSGVTIEQNGDLKLSGSIFVGAGVTGASGQVLSSNGAGSLQWITPSGASYTSANGVTMVGTVIGLGGSLGMNTTIGTSSFLLNIDGTITSEKFASFTDPTHYFIDPSNSTVTNASASFHGAGSVLFNTFTIGSTQVTITANSSTRLKSFANGFGIATNIGSTGVGATINWDEALFVDTAGDIGIGTTNPFASLSVGGTGTTFTGIYATGTNNGLFAESDSGVGVYGKSNSLTGVQGITSTGYAMVGSATSSGVGGYFSSASGNALVTLTGKVGIGTTSPTGVFQVNVNGSGGTAALTIAANGKVGIGTSQPALYQLDVRGTNTSGVALFRNLATTGNTVPTIIVQTAGAGLGTTGAEFIRFLAPNGTKIGRVRRNAATTVAYAASGTADLAEFVIATEPTNEGDLISFDNGQYSRATPGKRLAGIHSSYATFVGNEYNADQPNAFPLAISGIVKLKVSTENGPIHQGDPLSGSNIVATASKAIKPGFIVARALQDYTNSDPTQVGTIEVLVNLNWYDPDIMLTDSGEINVNHNISDSVLASLGYTASKNEIESAQYSLNDSLGQPITRLAQFAQISSAKIKAGLISTTNLVAKNIIAETTKSKEVKTAVLTPLSDISDTIVVQGKLAATDIQTTSVTTDNLTATDATISTLYAENIISKEGNFGQLMTDKITALREEIRNTISSIGVTDAVSTPSALVADVPSWTFNTGTSQTEITGDVALSDNMVIGAKLSVLGDTQLGNAFVTGTFTAGEIAIKENFIETTAAMLHIQPSGLGSVHIMNDTLIIAENGEVTVNGNLAVSGNINTTSLFANLINTDEINTKKLTAESINVATSSATPIIAESGFAALATTSAQVSTNATAGTATLPTGKTELVIYNEKITPNSIIYLTPVGSTNNQVVYLKSKHVSPTPTPESTSSATIPSSFVIALDSPLLTDVAINWWIIN